MYVSDRLFHSKLYNSLSCYLVVLWIWIGRKCEKNKVKFSCEKANVPHFEFWWRGEGDRLEQDGLADMSQRELKRGKGKTIGTEKIRKVIHNE